MANPDTASSIAILPMGDISPQAQAAPKSDKWAYIFLFMVFFVKTFCKSSGFFFIFLPLLMDKRRYL
jgi:hypothetical protein